MSAVRAPAYNERGVPRPCGNCQRTVPSYRLSHGRCPACYEYRTRTGRERPPELYDRGAFKAASLEAQVVHSLRAHVANARAPLAAAVARLDEIDAELTAMLSGATEP